MYTVSILQSTVKPRYYIGHTENLLVRLRSHNAGKVRSTKSYRPWKVVYIEEVLTKQKAYAREMKITSFKGGDAFKNLMGNCKKI